MASHESGPSPSRLNFLLLKANGFIMSFPERGFTARAGGWGDGESGGTDAEVMAPRPTEVVLKV